MYSANRKIRSRIFNWLTIVSLLLGIGVAVLWERSGDHGLDGSDDWSVPFLPALTFWSNRGHMGIYWIHPHYNAVYEDFKQPNSSGSFFIGRWYIEWSNSSTQFDNSGVMYPAGTLGWWEFALHLWFLQLLCAVAPIAWTIKYCRRRPQVGLCRKCGYDLRASKSNCPECGEPIPSPTP